MKSILRTLTVASTAFLIASGSAYAEKPEKGNGNQGKNKEQSEQRGQKENRKGGGEEKGGGNQKSSRKENRDLDRGAAPISFSFGGTETRLVRDYYGGQAAKGKCPPGLAKKGNGCQPPGQAKQWQKGRALASDARYYDIPNELRLKLPVPPLDHKYVQLGTDLLLIGISTGIVVDAIDGIF